MGNGFSMTKRPRKDSVILWEQEKRTVHLTIKDRVILDLVSVPRRVGQYMGFGFWYIPERPKEKPRYQI